MKITLLTTKSLIDFNRDDISSNDKQQLYFILDFIINNNFEENEYRYINDYFVQLSRDTLFQISNKDKYRNFLDILISLNIITENKSYFTGIGNVVNNVLPFPKSYKLNRTDDITSIIIETENKPNIKRINRLFEKKIYHELDSNATKQLNFLSTLQLNTNSFEEEIKAIYKEKGYIYGADTEKFNEYRITLLYNIRKIENWNLTNKTCKYDDFSGRFFNALTNVPSAMRKCLQHPSNDLVEIDIRSSQVYFLSQLDVLVNYFNIKGVNTKQIIIEQEFKDIVLNKDIYADFAECVGKTRDEAKNMFLPWMYGKSQYKSVDKYLKNKFPDTYNTLIYLKQIKMPGYTKTTTLPTGQVHTKETYLNYILQYCEKECLFSSVENIENYYTVHDSVVTIDSQADEVEQLIYQRFNSIGLDKPKLKITRFDKKLDLTINI